ncbi:hypothetical protein pipiens_017641 [Culex pipiens pipiens]|uniref:PHD-type domain-containing protein n=1 Tax=Culex pipiens pipiens TaxID=38569 RepID=A0ABD1CFL3_CULPP
MATIPRMVYRECKNCEQYGPLANMKNCPGCNCSFHAACLGIEEKIFHEGWRCATCVATADIPASESTTIAPTMSTSATAGTMGSLLTEQAKADLVWIAEQRESILREVERQQSELSRKREELEKMSREVAEGILSGSRQAVAAGSGQQTVDPGTNSSANWVQKMMEEIKNIPFGPPGRSSNDARFSGQSSTSTPINSTCPPTSQHAAGTFTVLNRPPVPSTGYTSNSSAVVGAVGWPQQGGPQKGQLQLNQSQQEQPPQGQPQQSWSQQEQSPQGQPQQDWTRHGQPPQGQPQQAGLNADSRRKGSRSKTGLSSDSRRKGSRSRPGLSTDSRRKGSRSKAGLNRDSRRKGSRSRTGTAAARAAAAGLASTRTAAARAASAKLVSTGTAAARAAAAGLASTRSAAARAASAKLVSTRTAAARSAAATGLSSDSRRKGSRSRTGLSTDSRRKGSRSKAGLNRDSRRKGSLNWTLGRILYPRFLLLHQPAPSRPEKNNQEKILQRTSWRSNV